MRSSGAGLAVVYAEHREAMRAAGAGASDGQMEYDLGDVEITGESAAVAGEASLRADEDLTFDEITAVRDGESWLVDGYSRNGSPLESHVMDGSAIRPYRGEQLHVRVRTVSVDKNDDYNVTLDVTNVDNAYNELVVAGATFLGADGRQYEAGFNGFGPRALEPGASATYLMTFEGVAAQSGRLATTSQPNLCCTRDNPIFNMPAFG